MDDLPSTQQVHALEQLSERMRSATPPDRFEIEGALERGFGRLIALEAELQRAIQCGDGAASDQRIRELRLTIDILRDALNELRTQSSPPGPPRIGYGFVLPASSSQHGPRSAEGMPPLLPGAAPGDMHHN